MSCNCEGITCPCGIPCSCPLSPCGCTDCRNSANYVCQLCFQQINRSSGENTCGCFTTAGSAEPQHGSTANRSKTQSEESTHAQAEGNSSLQMKDSGARTNVRTDSEVKAEGNTGTKVKKVSGAQIFDVGAQVGIDSGDRTNVRTDSEVKAEGNTGTKVKETSSAQLFDGGAQVGVDSARVQGISEPYTYDTCNSCGKRYATVPGRYPSLCVDCATSIVFVPPIVAYIPPLNKNIPPLNKNIPPLNKNIPPLNKNIQPLNKNIQPLNKNIQPLNKNIRPYYASRLMMVRPSVSLPRANSVAQRGQEVGGLSRCLEQLDGALPENKVDYVKEWLNNAKISPCKNGEI